MTSITGGFEEAILAASEVLAIRGEIYPSTLSDVRLRATCSDGTELVGETAISGDPLRHAQAPEHARIVHLGIDPADAEPVERALEAIDGADLVLIGPGSLYTSILPNLAIQKVAAAIRNSRALRVYICNVMTQTGETDGYSAEDHLSAIIEHAGLVVDSMIINGRRPSEVGRRGIQIAQPVSGGVRRQRDPRARSHTVLRRRHLRRETSCDTIRTDSPTRSSVCTIATAGAGNG